MEQITKRNGKYYYGQSGCVSADDAYGRFRRAYHESLGREVFKRLDRIGQRVERIHGFGFDFSSEPGSDKFDSYRGFGKVRYRIFGLVGIAYCRGLGMWDIPFVSEDEFDEWFFWAFSRNSGVLTLVGKNQKTGRTSKRLKTRYR